MAPRFPRRRLSWLLVPILAFTPLLVTAPAARADLVQNVGGGRGTIDWSSGTITVTGSGAPPDRGTVASKRLMALRAARVDALRQLGEIVNGVKVDSETTVKDFTVDSDTIHAQMSALIRGAQQSGEPRYLSDGSVEVDLVLPMYGQGNVADVLQPAKPENRSKEHPSTECKLSPTSVTDSYTSVIVDCRGLGGQPAMSPTILDSSGGELYLGKREMGEEFADFVIEHGIVAYAHSDGEARQDGRAGNAPLILRAKRISGKFKADAVLADADAQKLLGAEAQSKLLTNAKVIFIL